MEQPGRRQTQRRSIGCFCLHELFRDREWWFEGTGEGIMGNTGSRMFFGMMGTFWNSVGVVGAEYRKYFKSHCIHGNVISIEPANLSPPSLAIGTVCAIKKRLHRDKKARRTLGKNSAHVPSSGETGSCLGVQVHSTWSFRHLSSACTQSAFCLSQREHMCTNYLLHVSSRL